MPALVAYLVTLVVSALVLLTDSLTGGAFGRFLLGLGPPFLRLGGVEWETLRSIVALYFAAAVALVWLRRSARRLAEAGRPPIWVDNFLAADAALRHDTPGWSLGLALVAAVVALVTVFGVILGVVAVEAWTLLALAAATLVWHALECTRAPLPAAVTVPHPDAPPCEPPPPTPAEVLARLRGWRRYRGQLRAVRLLPARPGTYARVPAADPRAARADWAADLRSGGLLYSAMRALGIAAADRLYAHQAAALEAILAPPPANRPYPHVVLATAPGSGRATTIFLAILERTLRRGEHVLIVTPDDATLEQQRARFHDLAKETDWRYALYDGTLPPHRDGAVPDPPPEVLFCTLAGLHTVLLPAHAAWREFWSDLALIVTPDIPSYTGIAGANAVQVFRRLRLVARHYGRAVQFLATARPADDLESFARTLWSCTPHEEVRCEQNDSSPRPPRAICLWMPPLDRVRAGGARPNRHLERQRATDAVVELGAFLLQEANHRCIIYCPTLDAVAAQGLRDRIVAASDGYLDRYQCAVTTREADVTEQAEEYDALVVLDDVQRLDDALRLAGRLGVRRNGGLLLLATLPSPASIRLSRLLGETAETDEAPARGADPFALLPLDDCHPAVVRKHLACALAEVPLTGTEIASLWGEVGTTQLATLRPTGTRTDREPGAPPALLWSIPLAAPAPSASAPLVTLGTEIVTIPFSTDGTPALRIDADRAAIMCFPGRRLVYGGRPWVLATTANGYEARPPAMEERDTTVPLYTVSAAIAPGSSPAVRSSLGDGTPLGLRRGPMALTQQLVATRVLPADAPVELASVAPVERPALVTLTTDVLAITGQRDAPMGAPVADALARLLHAALRAVLPATLWSDEAMVAAVPQVAGMEECGAAVLIYETVSDGRALVAALSGRWQQMLDQAYRTALLCPCRDGCPACLTAPFDRVYSAHNGAAKRTALRFLGKTLGSQALALAGRTPGELDALRYTAASDIDDLIAIAADVQRFGMRPLLGLPESYIAAPVRFLTADEAGIEGMNGFFRMDGGERVVAMRARPEEDLVGVLAHEYAHDWQYRYGPDGVPHMHPSILDPEIVPYGGRLLVEGFAQWMELRVLDGYGFKRSVDEIQFRVFDEYGEGYHIIKMIEDRAGVAGILERLRTPITPADVLRLIHEAGTASRIEDLLAQLAAGAIRLPPPDVRIEPPLPPPLAPPPGQPASPAVTPEPAVPGTVERMGSTATTRANGAAPPAGAAAEARDGAVAASPASADESVDNARVARALLFGFAFGLLCYAERKGKHDRALVELPGNAPDAAPVPFATGLAAAFARLKREPATLAGIEQSIEWAWNGADVQRTEEVLRRARAWVQEEIHATRGSRTTAVERRRVLALIEEAAEAMPAP